MESTRNIAASEQDASKRLDVFLAEGLPGFSRSKIKGLIDEGKVLLNGRPAKAGYKLKGGENIEVRLPEEEEGAIRPEDVPLDILYEDEDIIVVNKPAGMSTHPGAGRKTGTLVNALLAHTKDLSPIGAPDRPGIVHRLDKDTTGALVVAKNAESHLDLARQFKEHSTGRRYLAIVWGQLKDEEGAIDLPIGRDTADRKKISARTKKSRQAITRYKVLKRFGHLSLVELRPRTGRTHQIRVHLAAINHPVAGDQVYGKRSIPPAMPKPAADTLRKVKRQLLHAYTLTLKHPRTGGEMEFKAPIPKDMKELIEAME